jgi:hypothetical protein
MKQLLALSLVFLAACTGIEERQAHMQGQIDMVRMQKDAQTDQKAAEAMAKAELYKALAEVAKANPEQASAVTVALAVQGISGEQEADDNRLMALQPLQNEKLEFTKAVVGPALNVLSGVGVAAINASVAKTQSRQAARVQINDAIQDSRIVEAVAGVGMAAASQTGIVVSGNYNQMSDSASISQDTFSTLTETSTSTSTVTETVSNSENNIADSYNTDNSVTDYSDNSDNSTTDNTDNSVITYGGQEMTLRELIDFFNNSGESYSITIGESTYTDTDQTDDTQSCVPTFEGYVCS